MLKNVSITIWKIRIAKILYFFTKLILGNKERLIKRNGINFEVNLNEGIDLHLFLFGSFQKHVYSSPLIQLPGDAVIFDVGANVGVMSLTFAQKTPKGMVHSFEPTDYAITKMKNNLELNPVLAKIIKLEQTFIHSKSSSKHDLKAYSSWKLTGDEQRHPIHRGIVKSANNIPTISLDDYCEQNSIKHLDFIKIDTDGYEYEVLTDAKNTLVNLKPKIIFEIGIYIMDEKNLNFQYFEKYFEELSYEIVTIKGEKVNSNNFQEYIPAYGTVDLIAIPSS